MKTDNKHGNIIIKTNNKNGHIYRILDHIMLYTGVRKDTLWGTGFRYVCVYLVLLFALFVCLLQCNATMMMHPFSFKALHMWRCPFRQRDSSTTLAAARPSAGKQARSSYVYYLDSLCFIHWLHGTCTLVFNMHPVAFLLFLRSVTYIMHHRHKL